MKKIDLLDNETFTIKGALGEVYVFDGEDLFVDPVGVFGSRKATVIKSLRTEKGAQDWVRLAGSKLSNVEVLDTDTLKANFDEVEDLDESLPFHVVAAEEDDSEDGVDLDEVQEEMREDMEMDVDDGEDFEDGAMARTQLSQILEDAKELYSMIESAAELESWVQAKLTRAADYMNAISEYLTHDEEAQELLDGDEDDEEKDESPEPEAMGEEQDEGETQKGKVKAKYVEEQEEKEKLAEQQITEDDMPSKKEEEEDDDEKKSVPADPAMMSATEDEEDETYKSEGKKPDADGDGVPDWADKNPEKAGNPEDERKSVVGKVFKSLHAARQWNKFENPDSDRFYIDIMRSADFDNPWDRTRNMNAKYVVRDMNDKVQTTKGAYGNRKVSRPKTLPEKSIDSATREAAALNPAQKVPEDSVGE